MARRLDYGEEVILLVDPIEVRFIVHKNIVCGVSEFFWAACSGSWSETQESSSCVRLPEQDADAFRIFLYWLYTSELQLLEDVDYENKSTSSD